MASSEAGADEPPRSVVLVRRVTETEWASLRRLRLRALAADPVAFRSTSYRESEWGDSKWVDRVREGASAPTEAIWVAVQDDGSLVGMAAISLQDDGPHVWGVWVEPTFRGQGIGKELLNALLAWAGEAFPARELWLYVNPTLEPAVRLFRSRGFEPTGLAQPLGHTPGSNMQEMVRKPHGGSSAGEG